MSEPVLFDRNGEPIRVGDRFVWDEPGFDKVSGSVADSSGILWDGDDAGYIDRHPLWFKPDMYQHYTKLREDNVQEPLVRMGRNDLWRRGDTEIKNGRVVAGDGKEPVRVLCVDAPDEKRPCVYVTSNGTIDKCSIDGVWSIRGDQTSYDLIELSPAPKIEPWEFHEIPTKHWFRLKGTNVAFPCGPVDQSDNTILIDNNWLNGHALLSDYEHCPTHCGTFEPCGKTI